MTPSTTTEKPKATKAADAPDTSADGELERIRAELDATRAELDDARAELVRVAYDDTDDDVDEPGGSREPGRGDLVVVRHQDLTSGIGADVERYGVVVECVDLEGSGPAVRVAWLDEPTAPIPLDHTVHNRDDAPRVELV